MPIKTTILIHFILEFNLGFVFKYSEKLPDSADTKVKISKDISKITIPARHAMAALVKIGCQPGLRQRAPDVPQGIVGETHPANQARLRRQ